MGLINMNMRAKKLGGKLSIDKSEGFRVLVKI
jgi:signal transduction histidine kinase